jgi:hypothetical protein
MGTVKTAPCRRFAFAALHESVVGPSCRLARCNKFVSYLGYTGRAANVVGTAAHDPHRSMSQTPKDRMRFVGNFTNDVPGRLPFRHEPNTLSRP